MGWRNSEAFVPVECLVAMATTEHRVRTLLSACVLDISVQHCPFQLTLSSFLFEAMHSPALNWRSFELAARLCTVSKPSAIYLYKCMFKDAFESFWDQSLLVHTNRPVLRSPRRSLRARTTQEVEEATYQESELLGFVSCQSSDSIRSSRIKLQKAERHGPCFASAFIPFPFVRLCAPSCARASSSSWES